MTVYGLVCARRGSVRLPGKNTALLGSRSLVRRAIEFAEDQPEIDKVLFLTDYEPKDLDLTRETLASRRFRWMLENEYLASGTVDFETVMGAACGEAEDGDLIVLLHPTSPFRTRETVSKAIRAAVTSRGSAVSVVRQRDPHLIVPPQYDGSIRPMQGRWTRSQDAALCYRIHGAVFVTRPEYLADGVILGSPCIPILTDEREAIDIDTPYDLEVARGLIGAGAADDG